MSDEIWKDVLNYEGLYKVSNKGNILMYEKVFYTGRKYTSKRIIPEHNIILKSDKDGYLCVCLVKDSKKKYFKAHRLVAQMFIPNPENKPQVNHKDGDKTNNNDWNLEWNTSLENINHAINIIKTIGLLSKSPFSKKVYQYSIGGVFIKRWNCVKEASIELGFNKDGISNNCTGRQKTHAGFMWSYEIIDK